MLGGLIEVEAPAPPCDVRQQGFQLLIGDTRRAVGIGQFPFGIAVKEAGDIDLPGPVKYPAVGAVDAGAGKGPVDPDKLGNLIDAGAHGAEVIPGKG